MKHNDNQPTDAARVVINHEYSIAPLVVAVIEHAAAAARAGNDDALEWLRHDGIAWADAIGIEADQIINRWIANGCQPPRSRRRTARPRRNSQITVINTVKG